MHTRIFAEALIFLVAYLLGRAHGARWLPRLLAALRAKPEAPRLPERWGEPWEKNDGR